MTDQINDCIVVGAGPAGAAAALQMARDGLDVVLLERGNRPGEKNVMSGLLITDKLMRWLFGMWVVSRGMSRGRDHLALSARGIWGAVSLGLGL